VATSVHERIYSALADALDDRIFPVVAPEGTQASNEDGEPTAFAVYMVETQGTDQTLCDTLGAIRARVMLLVFSGDYDDLWSKVRALRTASLTIPKITYAGGDTGSDEPYEDSLRAFVASMMFIVDRTD
jgi:hypothetical protein